MVSGAGCSLSRCDTANKNLHSGFQVQDSGFRVQGQASGLRVQMRHRELEPASQLRVQGFGVRIQGFKFWVLGRGLRVES
jgi:hypothetical protein